MAKNIKRMLAMVLVMVMFVSALPMQALAAEPEYTTETSPENLTTDIYTTYDENGNETIVVKITDGSYTDESGNEVALNRTENIDKSGSEIVKTGSETKEWTEEVQPEDEAPEVSVALNPNGTGSGSASSEPEITGSIVDGNGQTTTTTIEHKVTVSTKDWEETVGETNGEIVTVTPVTPDEYAGKQDICDEAYAGSENYRNDLFQQGGLYGGWDMATGWLESIIPAEDENGDPILDENGNPLYVLSPDAYYDGKLIEGKVPEYMLLESGERSLNHKLVIKKVEYQYDDNGNLVLDENGNPVYDLVSQNSQHVAQMILWGNDGQPYYAYSIASSEEALVGPFSSGYEAAELSKSEQFKDDPEAQAHIRGIATHGYWGASNEQAENGEYETGSLAKIKAEMIAAVEAGLELNLNGSIDKEAILAAIENLNEGDALVATQAALWAYTQGTTDNIDGEVTKVLTGEFTGDSNGYTSLIYQYLLTVTEQEEEVTAIDQESMNLVVGDKVEEGVYTASLNFSLTVVPGENDELCVVLKYVDADGTLQTVTKTLGEELVANEDDSYTLTGLKLSENQDIEFDLKLEGIQYLEDAVLVHTATHTNTMKEAGTIGARHSTLVSVADVGASVSSGVNFTMNFTIDEEKHVIVNTQWNTTEPKPVDPADPVDPEDPEEITPPQEFRLDPETTEEIPEEPIPLAAPVITGDNSFLWIVVVMIALCGVIAINFSDKKRAA